MEQGTDLRNLMSTLNMRRYTASKRVKIAHKDFKTSLETMRSNAFRRFFAFQFSIKNF
jgi:hypothetical protein